MGDRPDMSNWTREERSAFLATYGFGYAMRSRMGAVAIRIMRRIRGGFVPAEDVQALTTVEMANLLLEHGAWQGFSDSWGYIRIGDKFYTRNGAEIPLRK